MRKITLGFMIVTATLAAGCGTAAAPSTSRPSAASAPASPGASCAPGQIGPEGASFISASEGWLLGVTLKDCWGSDRSRIVVRKTTDGGREWSPVPAPPAPWSGGASVAPDSVDAIYFADARDGWAFGPGLWSTHDGGATWQRVGTGGRSVESLAATDGHAVAAFLTCGTQCGRGVWPSFAIETAPVGSDGWRPVPGTAGRGMPRVMTAGGTAYALDAGSLQGPAQLLTGPADGAAGWRRQVTPCANIGANTGMAVTASSIVLGCAMLGAHPASTHLYRSDDSGAHWREFSYLGLYDGASVVDVSPDGVLLVGGNIDGLRLSYDGGRSWQSPANVNASPQIQVSGVIGAAMTSDSDGYVIALYGPVWVTSDRGRTWAPVTVS